MHNDSVPKQPDSGRFFRPGIQYWTGPGKDEPAPNPVEKASALLATVSGEIEEIRRLLGTV